MKGSRRTRRNELNKKAIEHISISKNQRQARKKIEYNTKLKKQG